jgi:hypothetical protein
MPASLMQVSYSTMSVVFFLFTNELHVTDSQQVLQQVGAFQAMARHRFTNELPVQTP